MTKINLNSKKLLGFRLSPVAAAAKVGNKGGYGGWGGWGGWWR